MFQIIIVIVIAVIVIKLFSALSKIIVPIIVIAGIILAAYIVLPLIAPLIPYATAALVVLWVLYAINRKKYLEEVKAAGIVKLLATLEKEKSLTWATKKHYLEKCGSTHVVSVEFYERVLEELSKKEIMSLEEFVRSCHHVALQFNETNTKILMNFLQQKHLLLQVAGAKEGTFCISTQLMNDYEQLFETEGCATVDEFSEVCQVHTQSTSPEPQAIAEAVLSNMVSHKLASAIELNEYEYAGKLLYKAKNIQSNSKMTRIEISLD